MEGKHRVLESGNPAPPHMTIGVRHYNYLAALEMAISSHYHMQRLKGRRCRCRLCVLYEADRRGKQCDPYRGEPC